MKRIAILLVCALLLAACSPAPVQADGMTVDILSIGRADCIIIRCGGMTAMIDTGAEESSGTVVGFLKENGITYIDMLFITHYDSDHIGGIPTLLEYAGCGAVYTPNYVKDGKKYLSAVAAIENAGITRTFLSGVSAYSLGDAGLTVNAPSDLTYQNGEDNEFSLIITAKYGSDSFLFAGDALAGRITEALGSIGECDFIKMPNHGDWNGGLSSLVSVCAPKYAVITCSDEERPSVKTVNLLTEAEVRIYLTVDGGVKAVSDGNGITVTREAT